MHQMTKVVIPDDLDFSDFSSVRKLKPNRFENSLRVKCKFSLTETTSILPGTKDGMLARAFFVTFCVLFNASSLNSLNNKLDYSYLIIKE
jgi:hypothetical protein